jgi:hypothetical protein
VSITEQQIAAALSARAGGITMDTITLEKRFQEVRDRGARDRKRRRQAVGGAALATAAAVLAAFAVVGGLPSGGDDDEPFAEREEVSGPSLVGIGTLPEAETFSVESVPVPFTFSVPATTDPGDRWTYYTGEPGPDGRDPTFGLSFKAGRGGEATGLDIVLPTEVYAPDRPWTEQDSLVAAPVDAEGWIDWFAQTGVVDVTDEERVEIGGLAATRLTVQVAELPVSYMGCNPSQPCVALIPVTNPVVGPARVGTGQQLGLFGDTAEVTVVELGDRAVLVTAFGPQLSADAWLPRIRAVVDSLRFT